MTPAPPTTSPGVLAIVTARGGSKGLEGKNLADLCGQPLIVWTLTAAARATTVAHVLVSTDDDAIAAVARRAGADVPFRRPAALSSDDSPGIDVVRHALDWWEREHKATPELVLHLQPTSPLRTSGDIDAAVRLLGETGADAVVGVTEAAHHPYWTKRVTPDGWLEDFVPQSRLVMRRQDLPEALAVNGAIYLATPAVVRRDGGWFSGRTAAFRMPASRSVDIDTALDLGLARLLLMERLGQSAAGETTR